MSEPQRGRQMPMRVGLCPEHRDEFWYPLADNEGLQCPCCTREMVVYVPLPLLGPGEPLTTSRDVEQGTYTADHASQLRGERDA